MPPSILVAYATHGGSTAEVAQAIGNAICDAGFETEVLPVSQVFSLAGTRTLILGAPLYVGAFPKEFHHFLVTQRAAVSAVRTWCFVLGPTRPEPADFEAARKQADKQLARYGWFHPVDVHIFGGRWDAKGLPFPFSLALRIPGNPLSKIPPSDVRDWPLIRAWATGIVYQAAPAA